MLPAHRAGRLPTRAATETSLNWSGYVDVAPPDAAVTAVNGQWVVPSVQAVPPGFSAMWTGIGGYGTNDLIQAGVEQDSVPGFAGYYAWYEMLPDSEMALTNCRGDVACAVRPGDTMTVSIRMAGTNTWLIAMSDAGHWSWSRTFAYVSRQASAEWILEAPSLFTYLPLANLGTTTFDGANSYTLGGATRTILQGDPVQISIGLFVGFEATPSAVDADADGFHDCTYQLSCPELSS